MDVEQSVKGILLDILDISEGDIVPGASLRSDLGATSVDLVEVIAALENQFDFDITDEEAHKIRTVQSLMGFVKDKVGA